MTTAANKEARPQPTRPKYPCMRPEEVAILQRYLEFYKPRRCLEYGIGYSTLLFSRYDFIEEYIGIDHNQEWLDIVRAEGLPAKVKLFWCPAGTVPGSDAMQRAVAGYVRKHATGMFDFVFIDGIYRNQCLEHAPQVLSPCGFAILHDSARKEHHPHIQKWFRYHRFLTDGALIFQTHWHQGLCLLWNGERDLELKGASPA